MKKIEINFEPVAFRISSRLRRLIKKHIVGDCYSSESGFYREAVRAKLKQDLPKLYLEMYKKAYEELIKD